MGDSGSVFAAVPLADRDAPLLWAAHVQVGPLVDAAVAHLNAWNAASAEDGAFVDPGLAMAAAEFGSHAWFLKCFKSATTTAYTDPAFPNMLVTRGEIHYVDDAPRSY